MNPEVSYIVVCFNSEKFISKCISSILNQSHRNYEIIIVDNDSQDSTVSITKEFCMKNKHIKLITNTTNIGYGNAITNVIEHAQGEFLAILNADVFLDVEWASNLLKTFRTNEKIMSASGRIFFPNGKIQSSGGLVDKYGAVIQRESEIFYSRDMKKTPNFFYSDGSSFMVRRKIFDEISFDPEIFLYYEDVDLSWKIRMLGYKIEYVHEAVSYHEQGQDSSDMTPFKFYHITKNRIYVCQKNYSLRNIIYRLPVIFLLALLNAILYDKHKRSTLYIRKFFSAVFWNLKNCRAISKERKKIRALNRISDKELDAYLIPYSIELSLIRKKRRIS